MSSYQFVSDHLDRIGPEIPVIGRSGLDDRVWVPSIPGLDVIDSEGMSSTSLRRVKAYVESKVGEGTWVRMEDGSFEYHGAGGAG